jgi:hypothetical protein
MQRYGDKPNDHIHNRRVSPAPLDPQQRRDLTPYHSYSKRHHIRLFPQNPGQADRSGNCPAGTVLDTEVVHPIEFDFFLQSHAGLLGTSRSAHYSVLHDDNKFS